LIQNRLTALSLLLLLLLSVVLSMPAAAIALTGVQKSQVIQNHFHFQDPATHTDMQPAILAELLSRGIGGGTYLDAGYFLCGQMDVSTSFSGKNFRAATFDAAALSSSLGYSASVNPYVAAVEGLVHNSNPSLTAVSAIYGDFAQFGASWTAIDQSLNGLSSAQVNSLVGDYIAGTSDPDTDAGEWSSLLTKYGTLIGSTAFDLHNYCRTEYRLAKQLPASLPTAITAFQAQAMW